MNTLAKHIHTAILERATALVAKLPLTLEPPARSERDAALDVLFARTSFGSGPVNANVIQLVTILTGYQPVTPVKVTPDPFMILYCQTNKVIWVVLNNSHGFAALGDGTYHVDAGCERMATQEEAKQFLAQFKDVDPEKFLDWVRGSFSEGTKWVVDL